jgi:DNA-binding GntR family transcriptional regulator
MQTNSANRSSVLKGKAAPELGEVDRVYRVLKGCILECEFRPGDFLAEADLARHCSTSRTPIREACSRLTQEKWITRIPNEVLLFRQFR